MDVARGYSLCCRTPRTVREIRLRPNREQNAARIVTAQLNFETDLRETYRSVTPRSAQARQQLERLLRVALQRRHEAARALAIQHAVVEREAHPDAPSRHHL